MSFQEDSERASRAAAAVGEEVDSSINLVQPVQRSSLAGNSVASLLGDSGAPAAAISQVLIR